MRIASCSKKFHASQVIDDVVVVIEDGDGEFVAAQIFPDVFDRIEFGSVGWQTDKSDVFGDRERGSNMIAGAPWASFHPWPRRGSACPPGRSRLPLGPRF